MSIFYNKNKHTIFVNLVTSKHHLSSIYKCQMDQSQQIFALHQFIHQSIRYNLILLFLVSFFLSHSYNIIEFNSENITLTPISFVEQPWVLPGSAKNVMEDLDIPKSLNPQCFYFSETTTQEPRMLTGWLRCLYSMDNSRCQQSNKVNIQFGLFQNILDISRFLAAFHKAWKVSRQPGELPEHLESFNTIKNIFNNHRK